ncbi:histidine kinase [Streptomyces sp. HNM0574]|uniref:sensor histidine kinase n=1 Tax=Streptomyces sp. HNM0574 TaxID=2714954 RepID=UPI003217133A
MLVALAGAVGGLLLWWFGLANNQPQAERSGALVLVPLAVMCLAALGRRTCQPWALLLAVAALAADIATGSLLATVVLFTDLVYAAVLYGSERLLRFVVPAGVVLTVTLTLGLLAAFRTPEMLLFGAICAGITITPAWTGALLRRHRDAAAAERLRAEQTALLAEMDRTQAVTAERARMARELHDVVANHLSAIAIHSTAALSLRPEAGARPEPEPEAEAAVREALGVIRENSVQGLAEMRRLIGLLRTSGADGTEPAASPTLDGLDALFDRVRGTADEAGLGLVLDDARGPEPLPAPVELTAYRLVQESVTNALKHASPGTVTVELARGGPESGRRTLDVRVTSPDEPGARNGPDAADGSPRAPGSGAGLIGMRERVDLLGGTFTAGPEQAGGPGQVWRVHARLPLGDGTTQP